MMGVTTKLSFLLFVASKCRGTVLSKPTSMSYACCSDLVPTSPPDWPPYCLGSLSDCKTYRHPFDLQFSLSMISMDSPVLFILMDLMTSWGFLVKDAQAPHCLVIVIVSYLFIFSGREEDMNKDSAITKAMISRGNYPVN